MRDIQFGFGPRHSTSLHLDRLVERTRNLGEKRLTGAVFIDETKAFDTVSIDGLIYKLTPLNLSTYIVSHHNSGNGRSKRPTRRPRHLVACGLGWFRMD